MIMKIIHQIFIKFFAAKFCVSKQKCLQVFTIVPVKLINTLLKYLALYLYSIHTYCILRGQIKGFNRSITTILFEVGSYRTVVG